MSNSAIWDALSKTDPAHTKQFKRAGGFKGTAIKPIWIIKMLTDQFGPCGVGWGMNKPSFEMVHGTDGEVLVYCTVECWHTKRENVFYGVGGDKVVSTNKYGLFHDDEAFKKAYTDAVNNAFKFIGSGADVHMGMFDDSKYVEDAAKDFSDWPEGPHSGKSNLKKHIRGLAGLISKCGDPDELRALYKDNVDTRDQARKAFELNKCEQTWDDDPTIDYVGIENLFKRRFAELDNDTPAILAEIDNLKTKAELTDWETSNLARLDDLANDDRETVENLLDATKKAFGLVDTVGAG